MGFKRLERALTIGFRWYGDFVGARPWPFFIIPLVVTIFLAPGLFFMKTDEDVISLFTPFNAPSRNEQRVVQEFSYVQPLTPITSEASSFGGDIGHVTTVEDEERENTRNSNSNSTTSSATNASPPPKRQTRYLLQRAKNKTRANPWFFVDVVYANESNIYNVETFRLVRKFLAYMYDNFSCPIQTYPDRRGETSALTLRYVPDFCNPDDPSGYECPRLDEQIAMLEGFMNRSAHETSPENSKIRLTYPVMYVFNRPVNWGYFLHGAEVNRSNSMLETARLFSLKLQFQHNLTDEDTYLAKQCMKQMTDFIQSLDEPENAHLLARVMGNDDEAARESNSGIRFQVNNQWFINDEVARSGKRLMPCIAVTTILVTLFTTISSYHARSPIIGAAEAGLGVLTIGLSLAATFSLLFACGLSTNFIVTITPLLTLCVGIDNDFLLIAAWKHWEGKPTKERLALAFAEVGPSLTITSINDILCFAVGYLSESPAISDFCLFTSVALALRYLYQLTFFSGALVCVNDEKGLLMKLHTKIPFKKVKVLAKVAEKIAKPNDSCTDPSSSPAASVGRDGGGSNRAINTVIPAAAATTTETISVGGGLDAATTHQPHYADHVIHRFFLYRYSRFLSRPLIRVVVTLLFAVYLALSFAFAFKLQVNINLMKLFSDDSPLFHQSQISERYVFSKVIGNVIVTRAPDFRNKTNIRRFMEFVEALERTPKYSPNPRDTTVIWLRDYLEFVSLYLPEPGSEFYDYLIPFLQKQEYSKYINDMRFEYDNTINNGDKLRVESFLFTTYYENVTSWGDCADILLLWRSVCGNYSDFGAIVHDYYYRNSYLDQRLTLSRTTLQTMGIASLSIAFVTGLLMPDAASIFFICFSSLSVDLGVIAALNTLGSDLDPITMSCLLMTIGFSVYYTARICYSYQLADKRLSIRSKLANTLGSVGWPILQGGLATWLGILPLAFIPGYMVRTFFWTVVLVVLVGLLHGLVFMPVLLSLCDRHHETMELLEAKRRAFRKEIRS